MAALLRNLTLSAVVAAAVSLGGAAVEKLVEVAGEHYANHSLKEKLEEENHLLSKNHRGSLVANLVATYENGAQDDQFRRRLLNDANVDNYKRFYLLFFVSLCPLPNEVRDELDDFRNSDWILRMKKDIAHVRSPSFDDAICKYVTRHPELEGKMKEVFSPPSWRVDLWVEVFVIVFGLVVFLLQTELHKKLRAH